MSKKEKELTVSKILLGQYDNSWKMLNQAIENASHELWSEINEWGYSFNIYHIIETVEFYFHNSPESMEWGKRANINWEKDTESSIAEKKKKITKDDLLRYLKEIKLRTKSIFESTRDTALYKKDEFHWFNSILEKYLYSLRHSMHHIGELNKALRDNDCPRIKWS